VATPNVVDSGVTVVQGGKFILDNVLKLDGAAYNLTGKTVVCTIRREDEPGTVIDTDLEDISAAIDSAIGGEVSVVVTAAMSALLNPALTTEADVRDAFLAQYRVDPDKYYPQLLRFYVRRQLD